MTTIDLIKQEFGAEIALVILCCRLHFKTATPSSLQQFIDQNDIDWKEVLFLSSYHRIEPTVFKALVPARTPTDISVPIKQKQLNLVQQSLKRALETERIITLLNNAGIECVPYKGVALSKQLYGDIVSRESSDIDLVILPNDNFDLIISIMEKDGYLFEHNAEYEYYSKDVFKEKKDLSFNKFNGAARLFHIEFHWQILDKFHHANNKANQLLFNQHDELTLARTRLKVIERNAHYVAVFLHHAYSDGMSHLRNIIDIAQANSAMPALDANAIQKKIFALELSKAALVFNYLSNTLLGVALPYANTHRFLTQKEKAFFTNQLLSRGMVYNHYEKKLYHKSRLYLRNAPLDKIKYLLGCLQLRFAPSRKDLRIFKLPRQLGFLYMILKPFRSLISPLDTIEEKEITKKRH